MAPPTIHLDNKPVRGLLLIGHGTREERGLREFAATAELIAQRLSNTPVESAYLELARPSIPEGLANLAKRGVNQAVAVPLLLFAAGHAKRDIPWELAQAAQRFPALRVGLAEPLGCHPKVLELSAHHIRNAVPDMERAALVCLGRGGSDPQALDAMHAYAKALAELVNAAKYFVGFMAVALPQASDVLEQAAQSSCETIVVQPHLLFQGEVLREMHRQAESFARRYPSLCWKLGEHLGPSDLLVDAVIDRYAAVA